MPSEETYTDTFASGEVLPAASLNRIQSETEASIEERSFDLVGNGVVGATALLPSISTTNILLSSGKAYFRGREYAGPVTIAFSGLPSSVTPYYGYINHATETVAVSTTKPGVLVGFLLFSVIWNGSALSSLIDLRIRVNKETGYTISKTAAYTVLGTDDHVFVNASGGVVIVSLPAAVDFTGRQFWITKTDSSSNAVKVTPNGSELINGLSQIYLHRQWDIVLVVATSTGWIARKTGIIGGKTVVTFDPYTSSGWQLDTNYAINLTFSAHGTFPTKGYNAHLASNIPCVKINEELNDKTPGIAAWTIYIPVTAGEASSGAIDLTLTATLEGHSWSAQGVGPFSGLWSAKEELG